MRSVTSVRPCTTRELMSQLNAAHACNDVIAAQKLLDALYLQLETTIAMANILDGAAA